MVHSGTKEERKNRLSSPHSYIVTWNQEHRCMKFPYFTPNGIIIHQTQSKTVFFFMLGYFLSLLNPYSEIQYRNKSTSNIILVEGGVEKIMYRIGYQSDFKGGKNPKEKNKTNRTNKTKQTKTNKTTKPQTYNKEQSHTEQLPPYTVSALSSFIRKPSEALKALFQKERNICFKQRNITSLPYVTNSY